MSVYEPLAAAPILTADEVRKLQELIKAYCGIKTDASKLDHCLKRAWGTLAGLGVRDVSSLIRQLMIAGAPLWAAFVPFLTVNETYFLREPRQLDDFMARALPELRARAQARGELALNILSAACSSGEEPYTLAMLLADARQRARITGIDLDPDVVAAAQKATYGANSFRGVDPAWRDAHFEAVGPSAWQVKPPYREMVTLLRANLLQIESALAGRRFDAIFCRNVLIYFERPTQLDIINQLRRLLVPGGYLFLGHSEMFFDVDLGLQVISTPKSTMYHRQEDA